MVGRRPILLGIFLLASIIPAYAVEEETSEDNNEGRGLVNAPIQWQHGPNVGALGTSAQINVPEGYIFANGDETRKLMEMMQNPPTGEELGLIAAKDSSWFVVFEFSDDGYVKDDDKAELDGNAILKSLRAGNAEGNKERERRGWKALELVGWKVGPRYDEKTQNLEWATELREAGQSGSSVNYNTRILGRHGVMSATLVANPEELPTVTPMYKSLLSGFSYTPGNTYAEWRTGDKVATYGLAALITGGAAAVAIKSGFLPKLIKAIIAGGIAVVAVVGAALKKIFGGGSKTVMTSSDESATR